jgi:hypothetical protein
MRGLFWIGALAILATGPVIGIRLAAINGVGGPPQPVKSALAGQWLVVDSVDHQWVCVTADTRKKPDYWTQPSPAAAFERVRAEIEKDRTYMQSHDPPWHSVVAEAARSTPKLWDGGDKVEVGFAYAPGDGDGLDGADHVVVSEYYRTNAACEVDRAHQEAFTNGLLNAIGQSARDSNPDLDKYR